MYVVSLGDVAHPTAVCAAVTLGFGSSTADLVVQGAGMSVVWAGFFPESPNPLLVTLFWVACNLKYERR